MLSRSGSREPEPRGGGWGVGVGRGVRMQISRAGLAESPPYGEVLCPDRLEGSVWRQSVLTALSALTCSDSDLEERVDTGTSDRLELLH